MGLARRRWLARAGLIATLLALGAAPLAWRSAGAAPVAQGATVTVFAAASLTDAFKELGDVFVANGGPPIVFNFGASTQLRAQLEQGAPADVFASADQAQMDRARSAGAIAGPDLVFATNQLVVIAPAANPAGITGPADLAKPGVKLVTTSPEVPVGVYTQTMFERMSQDPRFGVDFADRANANVVSREPNVRQIVAKVQLGEADAAVVYVSDLTPQAAPGLVRFDIPVAYNTLASYPLALVNGGSQVEAGAAFVALVLSPIGQSVLARWGFVPIGPTASVPTPDGPTTDGFTAAGPSLAATR